jgi:predicted nuclease of predicted toxin-antitoxin system
VKSLLLDMCVDQRHVAPAFLKLAQGAFITDWIKATSSDEAILELARKLDRILVTEDADFGDLIFRDGLPPPPGVILVMTPLIPKEDRAQRLDELAAPSLNIALGNFVVLGPTRYRYRPFPSSP